ncbi:MAG: fibronectin type III domain-containing protein [Deltaproteobacteria bacterium]|nr:fibronectin type III domain-containing protein [Deltaproteobacteria bacterium]
MLRSGSYLMLVGIALSGQLALAQFGFNVSTFFKTQIPTAPSSLSATAISGSQINLSWTDNSSNESGFKIDGSPNGATGWATITTTAANTVSYSHTGLTSSTTYYYRVYAYNGAGSSTLSNVANATTPCVAVHGSLAYSSSGSFTVPTCITSVTAEVWGGGGAGGSAKYAIGAAGGGGGGYARKVLNVTPGQVIGFTVGGGGVNGRGTGNNTSGGASSCDTMYAGGGTGGQDDPYEVGGHGGSASGGSVNQPGAEGIIGGGSGTGGLSGSGTSSPGGGGDGGGPNCVCDGAGGAAGQVKFTY